MTPAAIQAAGAVLKTQQGGSISAGVWTLVAVALAGVLSGWGIWLRWGPTWKKTEQDGETQLRTEMWRDIEALKLSKEDSNRRLTLAETKLVEQSVELGQHRFLMMMVLDELDRVSPGNPVAAQTRRLIAEMQRQAMPAAEEVAPMAEILSKMQRVDTTTPEPKP